MTEFEIALTRAYLTASGQDPVKALIRSVKDLARVRRYLAGIASRDIEESASRIVTALAEEAAATLAAA